MHENRRVRTVELLILVPVKANAHIRAVVRHIAIFPELAYLRPPFTATPAGINLHLRIPRVFLEDSLGLMLQ